LLLKLIPVRREKDAIDVMALLIDKRGEVNMNKISEECREYGVKDHLISQLRRYADSIRKGEMERLWFGITGLRLTQKQKREVLKFIREMIDKLRVL